MQFDVFVFDVLTSIGDFDCFFGTLSDRAGWGTADQVQGNHPGTPFRLPYDWHWYGTMLFCNGMLVSHCMTVYSEVTQTDDAINSEHGMEPPNLFLIGHCLNVCMIVQRHVDCILVATGKIFMKNAS